MEQRNVLVLTVGTGNMDAPEESLLKPLAKSIDEGEWCKVFLLPSSVTKGFAARLAERFPDLSVQIEPLPEPNMENDADACYGHFDKVLSQLLENYEATSVTVDFTRGTKAMSAALVLAAVRRDIPRLQYVWGERDNRGMVVAGMERIEQFATERVTARRRIDAAKRLMDHGNFAAARDLMSDRSGQSGERLPKSLHDETTMLRRQAEFCAAWDRLDYAEADRLASEARPEDDLSDEARWVSDLAQAPKKKDHASMARWLRAIACDLLENGRRRIQDQHFEDALLRAYRILELVGQFRLFDHGIDSASIDPNLEAVSRLKKKLKKGSQDFGIGQDDRLTAPRELAARLLRCLEDPLGDELLKFDEKHGGIDAKERNHSILIHGFEAKAKSHSASSFHSLYEALEELLRKDVATRARLTRRPVSMMRWRNCSARPNHGLVT